ncbi:MAG: TPM domain-containing protein [Deltaproteobacteria bacterium]|nr:MAG: TPM domain-containing protein [Deltaproteobacteria bacterium]
MLVRMGRALAILLFVAGPALAADRYPAFTDYVVDTANILDANSVARIQTIASRLNDAGIAQIAVATVPDLGDKTKEEYAVGLFEAWKLGHGKPRADGLLILMVPGAPGHRKIKAEVGYGLEGILPDGKVTALIDQYAVPSMKRDAYGPAAADLVQAYARVIEANAGAGGELAPTAGARRAAGNQSPIAGVGGLAIAISAMVILLIALASSGARRRFPGARTAFVAAGLIGAAALGLLVLGSVAGWIALLVGLVVNGLAFASIRAHRCPRDGSWMSIDEEVIDEPTYWSSGLARVVEACTNPRCGYRRQYDKELPRKQRTVYIGGGGFGGGGGGGGWGGGGGGDGFSGGGGGDSGGGGGGREV